MLLCPLESAPTHRGPGKLPLPFPELSFSPRSEQQPQLICSISSQAEGMLTSAITSGIVRKAAAGDMGAGSVRDCGDFKVGRSDDDRSRENCESTGGCVSGVRVVKTLCNVMLYNEKYANGVG